MSNDTEGHRAIMEAVIDGDTDKAARLLQTHLRFTADIILKHGNALNMPPAAEKRRKPSAPTKARKPTRHG